MSRMLKAAFAAAVVAGTAAGMFASLPRAEGLVCASCKGDSPCKACKSCSSCKHCKKEGGTCGACSLAATR